jgi:hypothetical protein
LKNSDREKVVGCHISCHKNDQVSCSHVPFDYESWKVLVIGLQVPKK